MNGLTPTIQHLILTNVMLFIIAAFNLIPFIDNFKEFLALQPYHSPNFAFYQILTSMFMHENIPHLLFNMLGLYFIGPIVEKVLGTNRFLFLYFSAGIASALLHLAIENSPVVGASGAIYGVLAAFAVMFPNTKMMVFPIPFEVKAIYLVSAYIAYDLYSGIADRATGIAHFAHVGGAMAGIFIIFMWNKTRLN